jgi:activator of 2-hydroxyglutaryl-CoA dehydratase
MNLETIDENTILTEQPTFKDDGEFYELLLNNFTKHHNGINESSVNMFTGIDYGDMTSTNYLTEEFYKLMTSYAVSKKDHPNIIKIYTNAEEEKFKKADDLFVLKINEISSFYSQNKFALLIKVTSDKMTNWKIETLR